VTSPIPDVTNPMMVSTSNPAFHLLMGLASLSYATRALLLGSAVLKFGATTVTLDGNTQASQASFLDIPVTAEGFLNLNDGAFTEYVWGDVLKGIENFSHNVTAGLLTL